MNNEVAVSVGLEKIKNRSGRRKKSVGICIKCVAHLSNPNKTTAGQYACPTVNLMAFMEFINWNWHFIRCQCGNVKHSDFPHRIQIKLIHFAQPDSCLMDSLAVIVIDMRVIDGIILFHERRMVYYYYHYIVQCPSIRITVSFSHVCMSVYMSVYMSVCVRFGYEIANRCHRYPSLHILLIPDWKNDFEAAPTHLIFYAVLPIAN